MKNHKQYRELKKLEEVCCLTRGSEPGSDSYNKKMVGHRFIRVADISKRKTDPIWTNGENLVFCNKENILMTFDGTPGVVSRGIEGAISSGIRIIEPKKKNTISEDYLYYALRTDSVQRIVKRYTIGSSLLHASKSIPYIDILVPPLPIQRKTATILETCESAIQNRKEANRLTDEFLKSTFSEMFGDPVRNLKKYKISDLGKYAKLQGGFAFNSNDYIQHGIRLVRISNVHRDELIWHNISYLPISFLEKYKDFKLEIGDIVMSMTRPIIKSLDSVKVAKITEKDLPCLLNQRVGRFLVRSKGLNRDYLLCFCYSPYFKYQVEKYCSVSLQPNISAEQIEAIKIVIPPLPEQRKFTSIVQKVEELKQKQRESEKQLTNLFNSLMQRAFKGEL